VLYDDAGRDSRVIRLQEAAPQSRQA